MILDKLLKSGIKGKIFNGKKLLWKVIGIKM